MSTRGAIFIENSDGSLDGVVVCSDAYVEYAGLVLYSFYDTEAKVRDLISGGELCFLGVRKGHKYDYDKVAYNTKEYWAMSKQCTYWHRDRGEDGPVILRYKNRKRALEKIRMYVSYVYIFKNGVWYVRTTDTNDKPRLLKLAIYDDWKERYKKSSTLINCYISPNDLTEKEVVKLQKAYKELGIKPVAPK